MPIYEYICGKCHTTTEVLQKFSDPPLAKCPHCKGKLKRVISKNSFHLKGNGWYVTDYTGSKPIIREPEETSVPSVSETTNKTKDSPAPDNATVE